MMLCHHRPPDRSQRGFLPYISRQRRVVEEWLVRHDRAHTFSLARYQLHTRTSSWIERYAVGRCLDVGTGHSPHQCRLRRRAIEVVTLDLEDRAGGVDIIADVQDMTEIGDGSFDVVLCTQVLEHVPRPWDAVAEIARVLRPGGAALVSVPHLSAIHEAPHDYFRFTEYGIRSLADDCGLEVEELERCGGLVAFLTHYLSLILLCVTASVPGLRALVRQLNYLLLVRAAEPADRLLGFSTLFPCNYLLLARKPERLGESTPDPVVAARGADSWTPE